MNSEDKGPQEIEDQVTSNSESIPIRSLKIKDIIPNEYIANLVAFSQQIEVLGSRLNQQFQPILAEINSFSELISPAFERLNKYLEQHGPRLVELFDRFQEFERKFSQIHEKDMTFLPPFFAKHSLPEIREFLFKSDRPAIELYNDFFSVQHNAESLWQSWSVNEYFSPDRLEILKDALESHVEKKFTLSIPALMNQLEGLILEIFEIDQGQIHWALKEGFPKENSSSPPAFSSETYVIHSILLAEVFNSSRKDGTKAKGIYPHRPTLQHGLSSDYYKDPYASTRLIMLIDFISSQTFLDGAQLYKQKKSSKKNQEILPS